jgi:AraC-like DNA-binding protein
MNNPLGPRVIYSEWHGRIETAGGTPGNCDHVVFSNLEPVSLISKPQAALGIRFVGRGRESYRIGSRAINLDEANVMVSSELDGAEVDIPKFDRDGTLALCVFLRNELDFEWPCGPMVFGSSSLVGQVMARHATALRKTAMRTDRIAAELVRDLADALPGLARFVVAQAAAVDAAKPSTRYEMIRRANLTQAYLHAVTDRAVKLDEMARVIGSSKFHLLRAFQACFGETPAQYHRRLRLNLAMETAGNGHLSLGAAAQFYGFADSSSYSHAYRRTFGRSPKWSKHTKG